MKLSKKLTKVVEALKYAEGELGVLISAIESNEDEDAIEGLMVDLKIMHLAIGKVIKEVQPKMAYEIAYDKNTGEILWQEPYMMSRIHGKGERFTKNSKNYFVHSGSITHTDGGSAIIEHVIEEQEGMS